MKTIFLQILVGLCLLTFSCSKQVESPQPQQITQIEYRYAFLLGTLLVQGTKDSIRYVESAYQFDPQPTRDSVILDTIAYRKGYLDSLVSLIDVHETWNLKDNTKYPSSWLTIRAVVTPADPIVPTEEKTKVIKFEDKPGEIEALVNKMTEDRKSLRKR